MPAADRQKAMQCANIRKLLRTMKHLFLTAVLALLSLGASAQSKTWEVGGKLDYATDAPHFGIGAFARYNIDGHFRPEAAVNFYPSDNHVSGWDMSLNLHYIFHITDKFKLYPLGGLSVVGYAFDYDGPDSSSKTRAGFNLGGGLQYHITDNIRLNAESYYKFTSDYDRAVINVGIAYVF